MSVETAHIMQAPMARGETSGGGVLEQAHDWLISVAGALVTLGTTSNGQPGLWCQSLASAEQTNSGLSSDEPIAESGAAVGEVRRRSGLTWNQLARLFGVTRRSVHFWASGERLSTAHRERLMRLLAVIRYIDRGTARDTLATLVTPLADGVIPLDLLVNDKLDECKARLGPGAQASTFTMTPIAASASAARRPMPPDERVGALQASVHREIGKSRIARSVKAPSDR